MRRSLLSASALCADEVKNGKGEVLGRLDEIMIDLDDGRIAYAVLATRTAVGGEKLFALPWSMLRTRTDDATVVVDVSMDVLERAPGFERGSPPDFADPGIGTQIHAHYDVKPYWEGIAGQPR